MYVKNTINLIKKILLNYYLPQLKRFPKRQTLITFIKTNENGRVTQGRMDFELIPKQSQRNS